MQINNGDLVLVLNNNVYDTKGINPSYYDYKIPDKWVGQILEATCTTGSNLPPLILTHPTDTWKRYASGVGDVDSCWAWPENIEVVSYAP